MTVNKIYACEAESRRKAISLKEKLWPNKADKYCNNTKAFLLLLINTSIYADFCGHDDARIFTFMV